MIRSTFPAGERAGEREGVFFHNARPYDFGQREQPFMRLAFSYLDEVELGEAVRRMARALTRARTSQLTPVARVPARRTASDGGVGAEAQAKRVAASAQAEPDTVIASGNLAALVGGWRRLVPRGPGVVSQGKRNTKWIPSALAGGRYPLGDGRTKLRTPLHPCFGSPFSSPRARGTAPYGLSVFAIKVANPPLLLLGFQVQSAHREPLPRDGVIKVRSTFLAVAPPLQLRRWTSGRFGLLLETPPCSSTH
jgi:hypothetical protein